MAKKKPQRRPRKRPEPFLKLVEAYVEFAARIAKRDGWVDFNYKTTAFHDFLWRSALSRRPDHLRENLMNGLAWMESGAGLEKGDKRGRNYMKVLGPKYQADVQQFMIENEALYAAVMLEADHTMAHPVKPVGVAGAKR